MKKNFFFHNDKSGGVGLAVQVWKPLLYFMFPRWLLACQPSCMYSGQKEGKMEEQKGTPWFSIPFEGAFSEIHTSFALHLIGQNIVT